MKKSLVVLLVAAWMLSFRASSSKTPINDSSSDKNRTKAEVAMVDKEVVRSLTDYATNAFIFSYPLVLMELMRKNLSDLPLNKFSHTGQMTRAKSRTKAYANADILTSTLWFDISKNPLVIHTDSNEGRFFELSFKDMWTEVFTTPGSALGMKDELKIILVPEGYRGEIPVGYKKITAPTSTGQITARIELKNANDLEAALTFQGLLTAMSLKEWQSKAIFESSQMVSNYSSKEISAFDQIESMALDEYYNLFLSILIKNPPRNGDWNTLEELKQLGIDSDQSFNFKKLSSEIKMALTSGREIALSLIKNYQKGAIENGWDITREATGRFGSSYLARAAAAWQNNSSHLAASYIEATTQIDFNGQMLDGNSDYTLRFMPSNLPPTNSFWSLTIYNAKGVLIENRNGLYGLTSRSPLAFDKDGSLVIFLQPHQTTNRYVENWLPTPREAFRVMLRIYAPRSSALTGEWMVPPILKTPGGILSE